MFIGHLLPAALAAWKPRRAMSGGDAQISRSIAAPPPAFRRPAVALPHGLVAVAPATRTALAAAGDAARSRFVELQMAVEPCLIVQADAAEYQASLRHLILDAIGRAGSGVLVTAVSLAGGVEIAVLDDGVPPAGRRSDCPMRTREPATPLGGTISVHYQPGQGTTVLLRLPQPAWRPPPSDADVMDDIAASADL
ncbi:MAG: hypothetical protein ABSC95_32715 [Acetobacteraceae bacterium]|jgi:signal transduction histidine kinase